MRIGTGMMIAGFVAIVTPAHGQSRVSMEKDAKEILNQRLLDPSSLQVRELRTVEGPALCGQYNAKNRLGGYVGFKTFIYDPAVGRLINIDGDFYYRGGDDRSLETLMDEGPASGLSMSELVIEYQRMMEEWETQLMRCAD